MGDKANVFVLGLFKIVYFLKGSSQARWLVKLTIATNNFG